MNRGFRRPVPAWVRISLRLILREEDREFFLGDLHESPGQPRRSWARELIHALAFRWSSPSYRWSSPSYRWSSPSYRWSSPSFHGRNRSRAHKGDGMFRELVSDLRFGARGMVRSPGFAVVALLTMALGIGANTAIFSLVHGVVLKPLPYPHQERIAFLMENNLSEGWESFTISPLNFWDWQERNRSMELLAAYQRTSVSYTGGEEAQSLTAYHVTEDMLKILGAEPDLGRGIMEEDLDPEGQAVVVLTHDFWERGFGSDPGVLNRSMTIESVPHTIVGILPEGWRSFSSSRLDVILPLRPQPYWYTTRGSHFLRGLGRLRPGVTMAQAQADFSAIQVALAKEFPDTNEGWGATVRSLKDVVLGSTGPQLFIFLASVGLVLLIACANLANMTLARAMVRSRELAIRTAVGAGRGRVVRQLLAESLLLAVIGGALGVVLAVLALEAFRGGWPGMLPRMQEVGISAPVLLFSLGLSLGAGVLFGLAPAMSAAGPRLANALRQGGRGLAGDRSRRWMRGGLVVAEVSLAVVLLVGTGLLVRSFSALQSEDPGFVTEGRLVFSTPLARGRYSTAEEVNHYVEALIPRLSSLPGAESVALSNLVPLKGSDELWGYWLEGTPATEGSDGAVLFYRVTPGYFESMGIPILSGRDIRWTDREDTPAVALVSASFADQNFQEEDPIGRKIRWGREDDSPRVEIVGVVGEVQHYELGEASASQVYVPFLQQPARGVNVVVKAGVPPLDLMDGIRQAVFATDPEQPIVGVQDATAMVSSSIATPRFRAVLMTGFGVTALLLAVIGLYGIMAYSVSQRTKEIGVRMALGASRGSVLGLIFREGGPLVVVGLAFGLLGSLALTRVLESMLFGVGSRDPAVFFSAPLVLSAVAMLAMLVPARRAVRVDPVRTLGEE